MSPSAVSAAQRWGVLPCRAALDRVGPVLPSSSGHHTPESRAPPRGRAVDPHL